MANSHGGRKQLLDLQQVLKICNKFKVLIYNETFPPVVKHDFLRIVMAIAAEMDLEIAQLDVQTAFLNGELEEEI